MSLAKQNYDDLNWVLAALQMMIDETMYHMQTFAYTLEVHHNKKAAEIFSFVYQQFKREEEMVQSHIGNKDLPTIPPWQTVYPYYKHPSDVLSEIDYLSTQEEAWKTIDQVSQIHMDFYDFLLTESQNSEILSLIQELQKHSQRYKMMNQKEGLKLPDQDMQRDEDLDLIPGGDFKGMFQ
jgi:hypothetical protein